MDKYCPILFSFTLFSCHLVALYSTIYYLWSDKMGRAWRISRVCHIKAGEFETNMSCPVGVMETGGTNDSKADNDSSWGSLLSAWCATSYSCQPFPGRLQTPPCLSYWSSERDLIVNICLDSAWRFISQLLYQVRKCQERDWTRCLS